MAVEISKLEKQFDPFNHKLSVTVTISKNGWVSFAEDFGTPQSFHANDTNDIGDALIDYLDDLAEEE